MADPPNSVNPAPERHFGQILGEFRQIDGPSGRILKFLTHSAEMADHAWQQRESLRQLAGGATRFDVCWAGDCGSEVCLSHGPEI